MVALVAEHNASVPDDESDKGDRRRDRRSQYSSQPRDPGCISRQLCDIHSDRDDCLRIIYRTISIMRTFGVALNLTLNPSILCRRVEDSIHLPACLGHTGDAIAEALHTSLHRILHRWMASVKLIDEQNSSGKDGNPEDVGLPEEKTPYPHDGKDGSADPCGGLTAVEVQEQPVVRQDGQGRCDVGIIQRCEEEQRRQKRCVESAMLDCPRITASRFSPQVIRRCYDGLQGGDAEEVQTS